MSDKVAKEVETLLPSAGQLKPVIITRSKSKESLTETKLQVEKHEVTPVNRPLWKRCLGILLSLMTSLTLPISLVVFHILRKRYSLYTLTFWTYEGVMIPSLVLLIYELCRGEKPLIVIWPLNVKQNRINLAGLVLGRGLIGTATGLSWFASTTYIGPAESSSISMSAPILTTILACIFFGESCGAIPAISTTINVVGLFIISRPPWLFGGEVDSNVMLGVSFGIGSLVGNALTVLVLRVLRNITFSVIGTIFGLVGSLVCLFCGWYMEGGIEFPRDAWDSFLFAAMGASAFIGQGFFSLSLRFEQASIISIARCADIAFAYMWQYIILHMVPDLISIGGTSIIVVGVLLIGFRRVVAGLPDDHDMKRRFKFLLW